MPGSEEGREAVVALPYYPLSRLGEPGRILFYGEAYISPIAGDLYFFALSAPKPPGGEPELRDARLKPRLPPGEYAEAARRAAERIFEEAGAPGASFQVGGLRGILKAIIAHFTGREEKSPVKATERLEWRLASDYLRRVLGVRPGTLLQVAGPPRYVRVSLRERGETLEAYVWREGRWERFRVLEILARRIPHVGDDLRRILDRWGAPTWSR